MITRKTKQSHLIVHNKPANFLVPCLVIVQPWVVRYHLLQAGQNTASFEAEFIVYIANSPDDFSRHVGKIHLNFRRKPRGYKDHGQRNSTLGNNPGANILFEKSVDYSIAYLVAELVRMPFGD